jgi:hypothetical protein
MREWPGFVYQISAGMEISTVFNSFAKRFCPPLLYQFLFFREEVSGVLYLSASFGSLELPREKRG